MSDDIALNQRLAQRERAARKAAETLLEQKSRELYDANQSLLKRNNELAALNTQLQQAQLQLLQSEKLASIGQLAAGVAHEINNPIGYVSANLGALEDYLADLLTLLDAYQAAQPETMRAAPPQALATQLQRINLDFLREDLPQLMRESKEGISRVRKIVQDLKDFSRVDTSEDWEYADLHQCLESTLNIAANEIKYKAQIVRDYGALPTVQCLPSQLNQVFLNILVNAAQAMSEQGQIRLRTQLCEQQVEIEICDTGSGMPPEVMQRIFEPFYTTKPVGKGTGLGLSLSYGIVQKHHGQIRVASTPGQGTCFTITLPVKQPDLEEEVDGST